MISVKPRPKVPTRLLDAVSPPPQNHTWHSQQSPHCVILGGHTLRQREHELVQLQIGMTSLSKVAVWVWQGSGARVTVHFLRVGGWCFSKCVLPTRGMKG